MSITTTKPVSLHQLEGELNAAGVTVTALGMLQDTIFSYDAQGEVVDLPAAAQAVVDAHVAMRDKTDAEYAAEFQDSATTPARKQQIRDQQNGLEPREQVPITQAEWDEQQKSVDA